MTRAVFAAIEDRRQVSCAARPSGLVSVATWTAPAIAGPGAAMSRAAETVGAVGAIADLGALQPEATSADRVNEARARLPIDACIVRPTRISRALYRSLVNLATVRSTCSGFKI